MSQEFERNSMSKNIHAIAAKLASCSAVALCIALSACGGGGSSASAPVVTPPPVPVASIIKFVASFEPACDTCSPARQASLQIAPVAGAGTLGNKEIAKVELSVNQGPPQVLTAPTAGQATYAFSFPAPTYKPDGSRICNATVGLEITVTDATGFSFKKYAKPCLAEVFDAFSDYGAKTVTYKATATTPTAITFVLQNNLPYLNGRYFDSKTIVDTNTTLPLKANDNDGLSASGSDVSKTEGNVVSVSIEAEGGALVGSSAITTKTFQPGASATLVCCGRGTNTPSPSPTETRTIWFVTNLRSPSDVGSTPFNVYYRVVDPGTGSVVSEFRGVRTGYFNAWPVVVKAGYELTMEASPQDTNTEVTLYVSTGTDPAFKGYSIGTANSNRPDAPGKVTVFCCAR